MFVLLDIEWIEGRGGHRSLTQLYAARVDEKWNTIRVFDALVCPRESGTAPWEHLAFNGYAPAEFCASDSEKSCVQRFFRWLQPDDVICCWHVETKNTLKALYRRYLFGTFSAKVRCMNQKVYAAIKAREIPARSLYKIAEACGLSTPAPEHQSSNDVAVMQMLFQALGLAQSKVPKRAPAKEPIPRQERNAKIIAASSYNYLYAPNSEIFHCRNCKQLLRVKELLGSVYYQTASQNRRPCKLCHPDLQPIIDRPSKEKTAETGKSELVKARLLGNQCVILPQTRIVGCCHNLLHPGKGNFCLMHTGKEFLEIFGRRIPATVFQSTFYQPESFQQILRRIFGELRQILAPHNRGLAAVEGELLGIICLACRHGEMQ